MTARRVDANQPSIVADLRAIGATVQDLHEVGDGCPDILVGFRGVNYVLEIKRQTETALYVTIREGHLSDRQRDWHDAWRGQVAVIRSFEDALAVMGVEVTYG